MKLDVKKIKRNFQKLTGGAKGAEVMVTPVRADGAYCTPKLLGRMVKLAAEPLVITPTQSMSILSLEVRDDGSDGEGEADFIGRRKKDVLHTIKTTTKMKRSQASTHINIAHVNLDSIKNLAVTGKKTSTSTSLKSFGVSLSNLFKPSKRIGRNQDLLLEPKQQQVCRNSSIKSAAPYQVNYVNVRESLTSLQLPAQPQRKGELPPPLPPRPAFMKQQNTVVKQKIQLTKAVRPTPYPRNYENAVAAAVQPDLTPRMNQHAQVAAAAEEAIYENHLNLETLNALKECTHDKPAPAAKTVHEVKHGGVSIRKKQPSMGIKAATLKTNKFTANAEAKRELVAVAVAPELSKSSSECSIIYDNEIDMLIRAKRQELDQLEVNNGPSNRISAATFEIIESIKRAKQEPGSLIPQSQSQQSLSNESQNLAPFLDNTSLKKTHTCVIAQKAPFSPASKKSSSDNPPPPGKKSVSTSTSSLHLHKLPVDTAASANGEPIYENDWSMKQQQQRQLQQASKYLSGSSSSLQPGKFLPKSTSSTSSASSLRSMDSTTSLSGSSCCSMNNNSDMDTIVSSASMNAMGALATLPSPRSSQRRLFLENSGSTFDSTMV